MEKVIKELSGFSGSQIVLMQDDTKKFIRKINNVERNYERLLSLYNIVHVPEIFSYNGTTLDMQYIHGYDMKSYLTTNNTQDLCDFIISSLSIFKHQFELKDYTNTYYQVLDWLDSTSVFPFTKKELIGKLPKILPKSQYHGDMTLENIIYSTDNQFYFIDPVTLQYDSWIFDIAKLRQDLDCKWFLRNNKLIIDAKLSKIKETILYQFPEASSDYLLILMLLRVFLYCKKNSLEYDLIMKEVWRLWK